MTKLETDIHVTERQHLLVKRQIEVEDLVSRSSEVDAVSALQDLVTDYDRRQREPVIQLRRRLEKVRQDARQSGDLPDAIRLNKIRNDILELVHDLALPDEDSASENPAAEPLPGGSKETSAALHKISTFGSIQTGKPALKQKEDLGESPPTLGAPEKVLCRVRGVSRAFAKSNFKLDPIDLEIERGKITAIVGRNASGKTTLLRLITGDLVPNEGTITYPGIEGPPPKRRDWKHVKSKIAIVPQLPEKWHGRMINYLNYIAASHASKGQELERFIEWYMGRFELLPYRNATWDEISGGFKTRCELVRALLSQPQILVLDEPLAYLDVVARDRFLRDLRAIAASADNPIPIVLTSQHIHETESLADQVLLLNNGKLVFQGAVNDLHTQTQHRIFEVAIDATIADVELALSGLAIDRINPTFEGFILTMPGSGDKNTVFERLDAAFGEKFLALRDISRSVRGLMSEAEQ